ncbi:polysaccharide biosynthesis protein [Acholeplasma granularum]|uniref:polysaccharide biosynthesis protein n=1 Tax=Acholeplasma granularum TaxID=264635 RepID=UPI000472861E|nr:nucleoside-diphosphate sugar epimerase/dehydratase [Acholeplasma granularum]
MSNKKKVMTFFKVYKYIIYDILTIISSYYLTIWVSSIMAGGTLVQIDTSDLWLALAFIIPAKIAVYFIAGVYKIITKHASFEDFFRIIGTVALSNIIIVLVVFSFDLKFMVEPAFILISLIEITGMMLPRIVRRTVNIVSHRMRWFNTTGVRTLVVGAGSAGEMVIKEFYKNNALSNIPIGFVDDNPVKVGKQLMGIRILGTLNDIDRLVENNRIEEVIIAIKDLPKNRFHDLVNKLIEKGIRVKKLNLIEDVKDNVQSKLVDIKVEDLLNRPVIKLDDKGIFDFIKDEIVLVTGGGGSIGSELCRQIFELQPKQLIIFDIYENNAYDIQMELSRKAFKFNSHKYPKLDVRIGSVYNEKRLEEIFSTFKPTLVFHAAAYKHVPLMEDSAKEAVRTNVIGTYNAAKLSTKYNVKKFVLVSSDKAVRATNIMGATKRFAELIIKKEQEVSQTSFSAVRFGNVLGSNGSVIPLFKKQIEDGGPVTVTHKDITRYFMTIPEAVSLILQSAVFAKSDDLFVLDMGEPVKIYEFAEKMIQLAGYKLDEIKIEVVGLRPGEKLYEELLLDINDPSIHKTENQLIFVEHKTGVELDTSLVVNLMSNFENLTNDEVKEEVSKIIVTYTSNLK